MLYLDTKVILCSGGKVIHQILYHKVEYQIFQDIISLCFPWIFLDQDTNFVIK
jgi:hypothetical protein